MNFSEGFKNALFSGQHTIISKQRPSKPVRHFRQALKTVEDYLSFSNCYSETHDFFASAKLHPCDIGHATVFIEFRGGVLVIGKLRDRAKLFKRTDVVYAAFFGANTDKAAPIFAAIPKKQSFYLGFGRENTGYYVSIASKEGWTQIDFESGECYKCTAHKAKSAHPDIARKLSKKKAPIISFNEQNISLDEDQQLHQAYTAKNIHMCFAKGALRLQ